MTAFFQETFTGTAFTPLDAKAPDVGSNAWADSGVSAPFLLSGGGQAYLSGTGEDVGSANIEFGAVYPDEFVLDFSFYWAEPSALHDPDFEHEIFSISAGVSRVVTASLTRGRMYLPDAPEIPIPYHNLYLRVDTEEYLLISTKTHYVGDLAEATHSGTLIVKNGFQKLDFLGITLLSDVAYDVTPPLFRFFNIAGFEGMSPDEISADIQALGAFDVITESFSDLVLGDAQGEDYATAESEIVYGSVAVQSGSITSTPVFSAIAFAGSASSVVSANTAVSSNLHFSSVAVGLDSPSSSALELNSTVQPSLIESGVESNLALGSVAASILQAFSNAESSIVFESIAEPGPSTLESSLVLDSVASSVNSTVSSVSSSIELGSDAESTAQIGTTSSSNLELGSEVQSSLSALTSVESHISFRSRSTYDVLLQAWTMNSQTHAMSRYNGLPYRSIAAIGNRLIALGDTGFFEIDSDADNGVPVDSMYVTGFEKLGTDKLKRLGNVDIGYSTKNAVSVLVREYGDTKLSYTYNLPKRTADAPRGGKVKLGKGLRSKYYQFTIKGQSLNLDYAQVEVFASENRKV